MKLLAFAATTSSASINKKLVSCALKKLSHADCELIDLNDFELPLFSQDRENALGHPPAARRFLDRITASDAIVVSFAEHNGSYSAAYKNLFDWASRIQPKVYADKAMILMSTSPGARGGQGVLALASQSMPFFGGEVKGTFSLPDFHNNFDVEKECITDAELDRQLSACLRRL